MKCASSALPWKGRSSCYGNRRSGCTRWCEPTISMRIDLNCDMGELDDALHEAALMQYVTSANIACGGHAGDEHTMERTARLALDRGVRIGAHPGYPDRTNFGRMEIAMTGEEIELMVYRQIVRLDAVVQGLGGRIIHVKPHGALYNVAVRNADVARDIAKGA